jgi:hypothetical protein
LNEVGVALAVLRFAWLTSDSNIFEMGRNTWY